MRLLLTSYICGTIGGSGGGGWFMPWPAAPTTRRHFRPTVTAGTRTHSGLRSARQQHGLLRLVHNLSKMPRTDRCQSKKRSETSPVLDQPAPEPGTGLVSNLTLSIFRCFVF